MSDEKKNPYTNNGAPKKWEYDGIKKNVTVRLTDDEKDSIYMAFDSIQAFIQEALDRIKK